jgi:hypothetical protein
MFKTIQNVYLLKKIYKIGFLESSGVPVLYIGRTVPEGKITLIYKQGLVIETHIMSRPSVSRTWKISVKIQYGNLCLL